MRSSILIFETGAALPSITAVTVTRKDYIQPDPIDEFRNGQQNTSNNNNQEGEKEMQLLFTKNATTNMLIKGT